MKIKIQYLNNGKEEIAECKKEDLAKLIFTLDAMGLAMGFRVKVTPLC